MEKTIIITPKQAIDYASAMLKPDRGDPREHAVMISLAGSSPVGCHEVAVGTYNCVPIDLRYVARKAILDAATAVILLHSHRKEAAPSRSDIETTMKLKRGLATLDISLVDHIIMGDGQYYSFADEAVRTDG